MTDSNYFPTYQEEDEKYLENCHTIKQVLPELQMFLDNMYTRLINSTFFPLRDENTGHVLRDDITLEGVRALATFIKLIPKSIKKGNEQYVEKQKKISK